MYRVLIIDDDAASRQRVQDVLFSHYNPALFSVSCASSEADFLAQRLDFVTFDSVFADIELMDSSVSCTADDASTFSTAVGATTPTTNGIRFVQKYFPASTGTQVIFITGYVEYCTKVYEANHLYFLVKPFTDADFVKAVDKAFAALRTLVRNKFTFMANGELVSMPAARIEYLESNRRKVTVHTQKTTYETYASLKDVVPRLPDYFLWCHKSFLVNMNCVQRMMPAALELMSGVQIPVSQSRKKETKECLANFLRLA